MGPRGVKYWLAFATLVALLLAWAERPILANAQPKAAEAPADYVIGPADVLGVLVWREEGLSLDVVVRPDGCISLPLVNDVAVAGQTPEELRERLTQLFRAFVKEPIVSIVVREIHSRTVSITGRIAKPGTYPLVTPMRALDLIARAGGLMPLADSRHIYVLRTERGTRVSLLLNYAEVSRGVRVWQDVPLRPGDTLVVP